MIKEGYKYHHIGLPTATPQKNEEYNEEWKFYGSGYFESQYGIEWLRIQHTHGQQHHAGNETQRRDMEFEPSSDRGKAGHDPTERQRRHLRGHLDSQQNQPEGNE